MATVLVVDDTASIRFLIRLNLELAGFMVIEAVDGQECLDVLAELTELPHAITIDQVMPRMDGVTAIARIRAEERYNNIPIIMVSTQGQQVDLNRAETVGVDDYVIKPFDPDSLVATVQKFIDLRR